MREWRVMTWNVNSLRRRLEILESVVEKYAPDVMCFQETKVRDIDFPLGACRALGYEHVVYSGIPRYNGVAILSKVEIDSSGGHSFCGKEDARYLWAKVGGLRFHNFYVPSGGRDASLDSERFFHKMCFLREMEGQMLSFFGEDGVDILLGDLNVAPLPEDVFDHEYMKRVVSHTPLEVAVLEGLRTRLGFRDSIREGYGMGVNLSSWWSYRSQDWRKAARGRRLDHIWVRESGMGLSEERVEVLEEFRDYDSPSDHAPLMISFLF
jgi:exodeoxyribonuclease-3